MGNYSLFCFEYNYILYTVLHNPYYNSKEDFLLVYYYQYILFLFNDSDLHLFDYFNHYFINYSNESVLLLFS